MGGRFAVPLWVADFTAGFSSICMISCTRPGAFFSGVWRLRSRRLGFLVLEPVLVLAVSGASVFEGVLAGSVFLTSFRSTRDHRLEVTK